MKKNLLLTCLLTLVAAFGMAQETAKFPIVLTTEQGLPGDKIVRNYVYKSDVFNLEEAITTLRFTVISTNTVDGLTTASFDGYSSGWGPGFPFFTMSELRIYNGEGKEITYVADGNAIAPNDGGGVAALNDKNEGTYLHTVYSAGQIPSEYHYIELELDEAVSSFSFSWNTRSDYHKNLITHMGITPGTEFLPYPEQEFQIGEQVTSVEELAEEGGLFLLQGNADDFYYETYERTHAGHTYFHSPCGGNIKPNAASLVYLVPDATVENGYQVWWLNNGHAIQTPTAESGWTNWTNDALQAATVQFAACDSVEGNFKFLIDKDGIEYITSHDALGKMATHINVDTMYAKRSRPNCYSWTIWKASINGAAIASQLQAAIDEADTRLLIGKVENDEGEYDALTQAVADAKETVVKADVTAAEILTAKRNIEMLTAAYAAVSIWAYVDSIDGILNAIENEEIIVTSAPDWIEGAYSEDAASNLQKVSDDAQIVIDTYKSLADVDAAIASIYAAIEAFWNSKVSNVKELPFRVGTTEDGLPGTLQSYGGYRWESPMYNLTSEVQTLRFTFFKTNNGAAYSGTSFVFPTFAEFELYDGTGNKIELTEANFTFNSVYPGDGAGIPGLCDGDYNTHCHGAWNSGQNADYDAAPDYAYIEVELPEAISSFKYIQYGRKNGVNTPTDFVIGEGGVKYTPEDIELVDYYNTTVGEKITDVSQITDDGFYALVGLLQCAPDGNGEGFEKFYTSNVVYGTKVGAPAVFSIRKTGDADGTFYIQSLADGKYWAKTIDDDGWGAQSVTSSQAEAAKLHIESTAAARVTAGAQEFPNTFAIYQYNDTVQRDGVPHPYVVVQDWGDNTGNFSITGLDANDMDGEGEWYIYKVTMDTPYIYWLKNFVATAEGLNLKVSNDPGFYSQESAGTFASALAKAQQALETNDEEIAKSAVPELEAAIAVADAAEVNPVVEGFYVIETANENFLAQQGVSKAMCTYYNDFEAGSPNCTSEYSLWWTDAPADYEKAPIHFKFQLISATNSEKVQIWLEDQVITAEQAANAYFVKSCEVGQYAGTSVDGARSQDIGLTEEAEEPYIIRPQGKYKFDFWHPSHGNASFHLEGNSGGGGAGGDIVYWSGTDVSSQWILHKVSDPTSIGGIVVDDVEGVEAVSTSYYTVGGALVPAPVKGVNIVKTVYANGVVKTEKIFVK